VLKVAAQTLAQNLRSTDVLGRIGGEEFSIFLPDTALPGALQVAENLRAAIEQCQAEAVDTVLKITASIGVASRGPDTPTMQSLQQRADAAMYEAKKAGRNRVSALQITASH
jgi:diguanylate cyclase (GGDEF)-like protein